MSKKAVIIARIGREYENGVRVGERVTMAFQTVVHLATLDIKDPPRDHSNELGRRYNLDRAKEELNSARDVVRGSYEGLPPHLATARMAGYVEGLRRTRARWKKDVEKARSRESING